MDRFNRFAERLGGKLGTGVCLLGGLLLFLGWNGTASHDDIRKQFPYLLSGGLAGLALIVVGAALLVIEAVRSERTALQDTILELRDALDRLAPRSPIGPGAVVAGATSFHRPTCRLVAGRDDLDVVPATDAVEQGLTPCRICHPEASSNGVKARSTSA
jgi:hypothetical protein